MSEASWEREVDESLRLEGPQAHAATTPLSSPAAKRPVELHARLTTGLLLGWRKERSCARSRSAPPRLHKRTTPVVSPVRKHPLIPTATLVMDAPASCASSTAAIGWPVEMRQSRMELSRPSKNSHCSIRMRAGVTGGLGTWAPPQRRRLRVGPALPQRGRRSRAPQLTIVSRGESTAKQEIGPTCHPT
eukprot:scaffold2911_cov414-Prasinococcus_capsulatus_cf.AAC.39